MSEKQCKRCGTKTPVYEFDEDTTTYYGCQVKTERETTIRKSVRLIIWRIYGRASKRGLDVVQSDEEQPLCFDCGGLLIGRFMQGRSIPPLHGKEQR